MELPQEVILLLGNSIFAIIYFSEITEPLIYKRFIPEDFFSPKFRIRVSDFLIPNCFICDSPMMSNHMAMFCFWRERQYCSICS